MKYLPGFPSLPRLGGRRTSFKVGVVATLAIAVAANIAVLGNLGVLFGRVVPGAAQGTLVSPFLQTSRQSLPIGTPGVPRPVYERLAHSLQGKGMTAAFKRYGGPRHVSAEGAGFIVTTLSLPSVLGIQPAAGRLFNAGDVGPGAGKVAVISMALARKRFGTVEDAVGHPIRIGKQSYRVVGVLPPDLVFPPDNSAKGWVPLPPEHEPTGSRASKIQQVMMKYISPLQVVLRPGGGVTVGHIKAALARAQKQYLRTVPAGAAMAIRFFGFRAHVKPYARRLYGATITKLELLEVAALLLVLLVLANLAGLTTADTLARRHEAAARAALGATGGQLYLQRFREFLMLGIVGWGAGIGLGWLARRALSATIGQAGAPSALSWPVLLITLGAVVAVMALGGIRRVSAPRHLLADLMSGNRMTGGKTVTRTLRAFIVLQLAASVVLLVAAGHFQANVANLSSSHLGFEPRNLVFVQLSKGFAGGGGQTGRRRSGNGKPTGLKAMHAALHKMHLRTARVHTRADEILARLRATPGIVSASAISKMPLSGHNKVSVPAQLAGTVGALKKAKHVGIQVVSPGIVATMGLKVLAGNPAAIFKASSRGIIISRRVAHEFFPDLSPREIVGKTLFIPVSLFTQGTRRAGGENRFRVAAVIDTVKLKPYLPGEGQVYLPLDQGFMPIMPVFGVRSTLHGQALRKLVDDVVSRAYPQAVPVKLTSANTLIASAYAKRARLGRVFGVLAVVALVIAAIGLFALLAYRALARRPEFAIRGALGATPRRLLRNVLGEAGALWIIGCVIGIPAAYGLSVVLSAYLPKLGLPASWVVIAVVVALGLMALLAALIPARRAAGTDLSGNLSS